jgi:hypothetical protein
MRSACWSDTALGTRNALEKRDGVIRGQRQPDAAQVAPGAEFMEDYGGVGQKMTRFDDANHDVDLVKHRGCHVRALRTVRSRKR